MPASRKECAANPATKMMSLHDESISARDYARLRELVYTVAGINLGTEKKTMLESRIKRRLKVLNFDSYSQYCDCLFAHQGRKDEIPHLIDVVTTNKTDFYREPRHFDFLTATAIPDLLSQSRLTAPLLVWSAGCSSGEEPYTLAIVLSEYGKPIPISASESWPRMFAPPCWPKPIRAFTQVTL